MKKLLTLVPVLLGCLLQGCVAGAFVAGGAAGTTIAHDQRSVTTMHDDQNLTFKAEKLIQADPDLYTKAHIIVATYNQVILLAGQAPTAELRDRAVQLVTSLAQQRRIFNEITIGQPTSALRRSRDGMITANVKSRMVATTNLQASRIKIVTENGVVYLMGLTSRRQADIAAIVARDSSGVEQVVKLIEYVDNPDAQVQG